MIGEARVDCIELTFCVTYDTAGNASVYHPKLATQSDADYTKEQYVEALGVCKTVCDLLIESALEGTKEEVEYED